MAAPVPETSASPPDLQGLPPRILFFDGVCAVCDRTVDWLLARDRQGVLRFATLQGETARRVATALPDFPRDIDTVVLLDQSGPEPVLELRSRAIFAVLGALGGELRHWARLAVLPRWLTDLLYRAFVRIRYRTFGKLDACRVPTPEERARFLP